MNFRYIISKLVRYLCFSKSLGEKFYYRRYILSVKKESLKFEKTEGTPSNYVWTMWLQEDVPELCKLCINTIKKFYPDVIVITEKNLSDYVEIPEVIVDKYKSGIMLPAHFSDVVRMCLLDRYGGTWIDATCFMTQKAPEYIMKSPLFILKDFNKICLSNYFIHSNANNYFTKCIKTFLLEYWKHENSVINYFFFHRFITLYKKYDTYFRKCWEEIPLGLNYNTKLMYQVLFQEYDKDLYDWLKQTSYMHKLTYRDMPKNPSGLYVHLLEEEEVLKR